MLMLPVLIALLACQSDVETTSPPAPAAGPVEAPARMTPEQHLHRVSMSLRGTRPSLADLEAVRADPSALGGLVDGYLASPAFGQVVKDMHDEFWMLETSSGSLPVTGSLFGYQPERINRELPEQPVKLVEHIVMNDRPYTELLTADYTFANALVADAWDGLYRPPGEDDGQWHQVQWNDGRPQAGILSESWFYLVYRSAGANHNRGRANAVSALFLCTDFLETNRIPDTSIDLSDIAAITDAVRNDPACAVCHDDLDPLASFFAMRPYPVVGEENWPMMMYSPLYDDMWMDVGGLPPALFGDPGDDVLDLGHMIAEDPRFAECTSKRFLSFFEQTGLYSVDEDRAEALAEGFREDFLARDLVRDIVMSDTFQAVGEDSVGPLMVRPEHLGPMYEDLVGFTWDASSDIVCCGNSFGDLPYGETDDLARDAYIGYRLLLGGVDAPMATVPIHTPTPTSMLVLETYASLAADHEAKALQAGEQKLLTAVSATDRDDSLVRQQLVDLYLRLYGEVYAPDDPEIAETLSLFQLGLSMHDDPVAAWRMVLSAMFLDLRMVTF